MLTTEQIKTAVSSYENLSNCVKTFEIDEIVYSVAELMGTDTEQLAMYPMGGYSKGRMNGAYYFVLQDLKRNMDNYDWLFARLCDEESRRVYLDLMSYRLVPDAGFIERAYDGVHPQYFDTDIVNCDENEIFVDCGGGIGDTVQSYRNVFGDYSKCYIYEPDGSNIEKIRKNLDGFQDVVIRAAGVGDHIEISLDDDLDEPVTFIKMDLEGFEIPAIIGAKNHILNDQPKLAISLHHIVSDMWEIPRLIDSICPDHRFYIRHYEKERNSETVLYAIPPCKIIHKDNKLKTAVTIMPYERPWSNVELVKDCGLIPYLLNKEHDMDVMMVGTSGNDGDYPYAGLVDGLKLKALSDNKIETKLQYLADHAKDIDLLILRGGYTGCISMASVYKEYNPGGLIYCGLDSNSIWMDGIAWYDPYYSNFLDKCDILATSCTAMADYLRAKWHRDIKVITNGYIDLDGASKGSCSFEEKDNIIFTAGRLGTNQKSTEILLLAYALIADRIPGWKLRLAGKVEESFKPFVERFFEKNPHLTGRVEFIGMITDRIALSKEYDNAKIFALTSSVEGGTPNVVAEALWSGCAMAVTRFDAWEDCIDEGRCGLASPVGDVEMYADNLLSLCRDPELRQKSERAKEYAGERFDMRKNVDYLYGLLVERRNEG